MEICAYREPSSVSKRKRAHATRRDAFDVQKTEFLAVGHTPSSSERKTLLHERFKTELDAVRGLLAKAVAGISSASPSAPGGKVGRRFLAVETPRSEEPPSKRRKASPPVPMERTEAAKRMSPAKREQLATDLAELAAELPTHVVELLVKQSNPCGGGEIDIDIHSMEGAAVLELKKQVDVFVQERGLLQDAIDSSGGVIYGEPLPKQSQGVKIVEEEEDVDICGGVSPLAIPPPVVIPNLGGNGSPSSFSSSGSGSESASGSGSSYDSGDSDSDENSGSSDGRVSSPAAAEPLDKSPEQRATTPSMAELFDRARESMEKERKEQRSRAREKARQELVEIERTAMTSDFIHPIVLEQLGINQYMVSRPAPKASKRRSSRASVEEDLEEGKDWVLIFG